jgi:riboflavin kinase/FMN adenylyltransferase
MITVRQGQDIPFDMHTALTVGTFDGVHCGHRSIIDRMQAVASIHGERTVVVTFDPHPQIVLAKPDREPVQLLTSIDERLMLLEAAGVDMTVVIGFTRAFAATPAETFVRDFLVRRIGVRHFFIGHDHLFGHGRGGNEELLQHLGAELDFDVERIAPLESNGLVVSSTKVRAALKTGDVETAAAMLGRPYSVRGIVVRGDQRGRKLGIPTANVATDDDHKLMPSRGVYVVSSMIDGRRVFGMANIGRRPTFTDDIVNTVEVHYLDFDEMLYDMPVTVEFHRFIRHEMKFESVDMFLSQIREDRATAIEFAEAWRG